MRRDRTGNANERTGGNVRSGYLIREANSSLNLANAVSAISCFGSARPRTSNANEAIARRKKEKRQILTDEAAHAIGYRKHRENRSREATASRLAIMIRHAVHSSHSRHRSTLSQKSAFDDPSRFQRLRPNEGAWSFPMLVAQSITAINSR